MPHGLTGRRANDHDEEAAARDRVPGRSDRGERDVDAAHARSQREAPKTRATGTVAAAPTPTVELNNEQVKDLTYN
jgi:hypothetical protein